LGNELVSNDSDLKTDVKLLPEILLLTFLAKAQLDVGLAAFLSLKAAV
jgi:hypothetical protein